jgi:hypothetical protein
MACWMETYGCTRSSRNDGNAKRAIGTSAIDMTVLLVLNGVKAG